MAYLGFYTLFCFRLRCPYGTGADTQTDGHTDGRTGKTRNMWPNRSVVYNVIDSSDKI